MPGFAVGVMQVVGPGACVVFDGPDGREWLVYHCADPAESELSRKLCVAPVSWTRHGPQCVFRIADCIPDFCSAKHCCKAA